jgi:hypothetical protein
MSFDSNAFLNQIKASNELQLTGAEMELMKKIIEAQLRKAFAEQKRKNQKKLQNSNKI